MRLSVHADDPGFRTYRRLPRGVVPVVRLAGQVVNKVFTADDRAGYILAADTDDAGHVRLNAARTGIAQRQLRGDVTIELVRRR